MTTALPFEEIDLVDRHGLTVPKHRNNYSEADGGFGSSNYYDEDREYGPGESVYRKPFRRERILIQFEIDRIQNQLNRHEDDDDIAPGQNAGHSNDEQQEAEHQKVYKSRLEPLQ